MAERSRFYVALEAVQQEVRIRCSAGSAEVQTEERTDVDLVHQAAALAEGHIRRAAQEVASTEARSSVGVVVQTALPSYSDHMPPRASHPLPAAAAAAEPAAVPAHRSSHPCLRNT